ncbi:MAG: hypothetical protein AB7O50_15770 [Pseudolabrys sp.]
MSQSNWCGAAARCAMLAAIAIVFGMSAPALAAKKKAAPKVDHWNACYDLGWVRGVHTEQGELDDWMDQCLTGEIAGSPTPKTTRKKDRNLDNLKILS